MNRQGLVVLAFLVANSLKAGTLELCVENVAKLDDSVIQVFRTELNTILNASSRNASFTECRPGVVTITLRQQPPDDERSALAGIKNKDGRLIPEVDVFTGAVSQILGTNLPAILGRALARVTTHELGHWLTQSAGHSSCGVMLERLTAAHLMAPGRNFFRLPPPSD
jgi:hypothetical protein